VDFCKAEASLDTPATPLLTPSFALLLLTTAIVGLSFSTYFLLPKFLAVELAADAATIGAVSAAALLSSVVFMPIVGVQVDRHGRRPFACAGALLLAASCAGMLFVDRVGALLWIVRVAQGAAFPLFYVSLSTIATDIAPRARVGQAIGLFGGIMIATNALGPALAEWGAARFSWNAVFAATVVAALVAAALAWILPDLHRPRARADATTMHTLVRRPGMLRVLVIAALAGWSFSSMFTFHQPWALASGFEHVSLYLAGFAGAAMIMRVGLGGLADRLGRLQVARMSLLLYVVAPLSLIWLPTLGLLATGALLGISHGLFFPALNAVAVDLASDHERGKAMAAYNGAFNVGFASGSYLMGYLAIAAGYPAIFILATVVCAIAFALLATTPARTHPPDF
jgi:MFS family permease